MDLQPTACCAVEEIHDLRYSGTPKEAMMEFVELCFGNWDDSDHYDNGPGRIKGIPIPNIITFTGVVGYTKTETDKSDTSYAPKFADFIKKHKLGKLISSSVRTNRLNHPTHKVKLWVWTPNVGKLTKWWKEQGGQMPEVKTKSAYDDSYYQYGGGW